MLGSKLECGRFSRSYDDWIVSCVEPSRQRVTLRSFRLCSLLPFVLWPLSHHRRWREPRDACWNAISVSAMLGLCVFGYGVTMMKAVLHIYSHAAISFTDNIANTRKHVVFSPTDWRSWILWIFVRCLGPSWWRWWCQMSFGKWLSRFNLWAPGLLHWQYCDESIVSQMSCKGVCPRQRFL